MAKYNERLVQKIVRLIEEDYYTINEICNAVKIHKDTFYDWKKTKPEFYKAIQEAEDRRDDMLADLARYSLREQLEGYVEVTEKIIYERTNSGEEVAKSRIVTKKKKAPKPNVLKLALERQDKRREKEELANSKPERQPFVIKFSKDDNQMETLQTMIDFKMGTGEVKSCNYNDVDESMGGECISVVI